jgi:DNA polymerase V
MKAAVDGLELVFREGFAFSKAEVLLDLRQPGEFTGDLFEPLQPESASKAMAVMDAINAKWGGGQSGRAGCLRRRTGECDVN